MIVLPKFAVLDTATLAKLAHDSFCDDSASRARVRSLIEGFKQSGTYIGITFTHLAELLGHADETKVRDRLKFLRGVPLMAWVRPYNRTWFPGSSLDLLLREIEVAAQQKAQWSEITRQVRPDVWETGTGEEIIADHDRLLPLLRARLKRHRDIGIYVASVRRTDPGRVSSVTLKEIQTWRSRSKKQRKAYWAPFAQDLQAQLEKHGDRRLGEPRQAAVDFANQSYTRIEKILAQHGDPTQRILEEFEVPPERVSPEMTIAELGELAVYAEKLKIFGKRLRPPRKLTMANIPPDALPSYVFSRRLEGMQQTADRVSGSDLGDQHIAALLLYADFVEVDKRTQEYLRRVQRLDPELATLMGRFGRASRYEQLLDLTV
jgi:hypothetical protein